MAQHKIIRLGVHGNGIADGPLYASKTLPGEDVSGDVQGQTLQNVKIITPSSDRVSAPCRHFKSCGGCQLQHASGAFLESWKTEVVKNALAAHGLKTEFAPVKVSPAFSRRRATLTARRAKKGAMAGFHAKGSDVIIEIPDCHLLLPALKTAIPVAQELAMIGASRKHPLNVACTVSLNGLDVCVSGGKPLDIDLRSALAGLVEKLAIARLTWEDEVLATRIPPEQQFGRAKVVPPPGAFLQATAEGEAALLQDVRDIVQGSKRIVDLFAGCGTFALALADNSEVHAVEGSAEMMAALNAGWRKSDGLKAVSCDVRDLFRRPLLPDELAHFDAAVIDPPRAGAQAQIAELCKAGVPTIAYVSCSPASFAKDAKTLVENGYHLKKTRVVDQFRWSAHVELVSEFSLISGEI